jgi:hypothetical protein
MRVWVKVWVKEKGYIIVALNYWIYWWSRGGSNPWPHDCHLRKVVLLSLVKFVWVFVCLAFPLYNVVWVWLNLPEFGRLGTHLAHKFFFKKLKSCIIKSNFEITLKLCLLSSPKSNKRHKHQHRAANRRYVNLDWTGDGARSCHRQSVCRSPNFNSPAILDRCCPKSKQFSAS